MALGARPGQVARLILRRTLFQIALGFAAGVLCTMMLAGTFSSGRAGVSVTDPGPLARVAVVMAVVGLLATLVPIRRATRMDPVQAIRRP
jgi:ABC-type antimicrobial peptide transport system permease subunit